jgi:hypothetical protein
MNAERRRVLPERATSLEDQANPENFTKKTPRTLLKSTRHPASSHRKFYEKNLGFYNNQPAVHTS